MEMARLKQLASSFDRTSVHVEMRMAIFGYNRMRLIGIGRKYVRLMAPDGRILEKVSPDTITDIV